MKRIFFCIITLLTGITTINAQNEVVASDDVPPSDRNLMPNVKNYDGFLLDMGLMNVSAPNLPKFTLEIPDASKDYSRIFQLNPVLRHLKQRE